MDMCTYNEFPVYYGDLSKEKVSFFLYDPVTKYFIIDGNTISDDFGPQKRQYGFLVAIDLNANW